MSKFVWAVMGIAAFALCPAQAKPVAKTKYRYYAISGTTAPDIYSSMVRQGPNVNGMDAYATTNATSSQSGKLVQGQSCRIEDYAFRFDFVINLPKLRNEAALNGATKAKWNQFQAFLKKHEETHTAIWLECARGLESRVSKLRGKDCSSVDKQAGKMWTAMRNACQVKHEAFDRTEQRRLLQHPFVRMVMSQNANHTAALTVPKKVR